MKQDEKTLLLILAGLWVYAKYKFDVVPDMERAGLNLYEYIHDDQGHKQDLPGHQLTRQAVLQIATKAGFPDPKLASAIAFAESGGVPGAVLRSSRENSIGLWQINLRKWPYSEENMKDPIKNAAAAFVISKGGKDWRPWSTYTSGKYKLFQTGIFA